METKQDNAIKFARNFNETFKVVMTDKQFISFVSALLRFSYEGNTNHNHVYIGGVCECGDVVSTLTRITE